jgi:hypothetical protein
MTGPTVEGSIVGHLKLDPGTWAADLDKAGAEADKLGAHDPTITVNAKVDEALAKLAAVQAAKDRLDGGSSSPSTPALPSAPTIPALPAGTSAATTSVAKVDAIAAAEARLAAALSAADTAYSRAEIAQMKLDAAQASGKTTAIQLAAAMLAQSEAMKRLDAADVKATATENALAVAQRKVAETAAALAASEAAAAAATDRQAASGQKAAAASKGQAGFMQMVLIAVASLIPLMAPLAGYFAAVSGSIMGMGAAGVLAVLGIKNAMAQGTAAGNTFSGGLHLLKGDLDALSATSANAMLVHFMAAISTIDGAMPSLNSEIRMFSGMLGTTGSIVLTTLVAGFKVLLPLFVQAGVYVEQLAVGFQKWTTNGGLAKFASMAVTALPQVAQALGALLNGVVSLIGGLAPLGTVMLGIVTVVGTLVSTLTSVLGPAFAPIVAGALAAAGGFQLMGAAEPLIVRVAASMVGLAAAEDLALGPIGWVVAGISAIAAVALVATAATNNAADATRNYTAAVQQDNGVVGQNVKAKAAQALSDAGALTASRHLAISTKILTDATLGHASAQAKLKTEVDSASKKLLDSEQALQRNSKATGAQINAVDANRQALKTLTDAYAANKVGITDAIKAYNDIAAAEGLASISTRAQLDAQTALAAKYGDSLPAYLAATAANKATADQLAATTQQMVLQDDASGLLTNALTILNGGSLSVAAAQTGLYAANNSLAASFKTNGAIVDGATVKAVANQQAIQSQVTAAQQAAEAIGKQTGSTAAAVQSYNDSKAAIEGQLAKQGDLTASVKAYIDKLYDVANLKVTPTKLDIDATAALAAIAAVKAGIATLSGGKVVNVSATIGAGGTASIRRAAGGTVFGPGSSTSDSIVTRLSTGEEVTNAARAGSYRPMLKAINNGSPAQIAAAASNLAGPSTAMAPSFTIILQSKGGIDLTDYITATVQRNGSSQASSIMAGRAS